MMYTKQFISKPIVVKDGGPEPRNRPRARNEPMDVRAAVRELQRKQEKEATPGPLLLDAKACAKLCGVGERTWWKRAEDGSAPPAVRLCCRTLWRRADIEKWIAEGCPRKEEWAKAWSAGRSPRGNALAEFNKRKKGGRR